MSGKVAVIMSVYRSDSIDYFRDAVESILNQTFSGFTLYIYRDGLVPDCLNDYLDLLTSCNDNVNVVRSEKNLGLAYGLNFLIDLIMLDGSYCYIARMDGDDVSRAERFCKQIEFLETHLDIDVCGTSCHEFGASFALEQKHLPRHPEELLDYSITYCPFIHPTVMFRASVFDSGIRYPTNTSLTEDMALWFVLLNNGFRFGNLNEILLDYRLNENTLERRRGLSKGISEFKIRFNNMIKLKKISIKNVILISARLVFHILPCVFLKIVYKNNR